LLNLLLNLTAKIQRQVFIFEFFKSRIFIRNISVLILTLLLLFFIALQFLKIFTHHGESLTVPDFKGYSVSEVEKICKEKNLRYIIIDSMYVPDAVYFTVVDQNPKPNSKVKRKRKIYITLSSDTPPKVKMPDLIDVTLRQAISILQSTGLKVGDLEYVPDIAQNVVLKVKKDGREVRPGTFISKGSKIDLVLGDGLSSEKVSVINLVGLTYDEAVFALSGIGLNIGAIILNEAVRDTFSCVVFKQYPTASDVMISQGEAVDVWLTKPENFSKFKNQNSDTIIK